MKKVISISAVPLILLSLYFARLRQAPSSVHAAEAQRAAFLIRFGVDGKADVDWSGSIDPPPSRIVGWQFDSGDEIIGAGSQTRVQFFARIVVDKIELDILIAAALSGLCIHFSKQVELGALIGLGGFGGGLGGFGGRLVVRGRKESEEYEDGR